MRPPPHNHRRRHRCAPALEALEPRFVLSTIINIGGGGGVITPPTPQQPPAGGPSLGGLVALKGNLLFVSDDNVHGSELWQTDGYQTGTALVKDINPGAKGSAIGYHPIGLNSTSDSPVVYKDVAYFAANDGTHGVELWRSDGTAAGTYMVRDLTATSVTMNGVTAPDSSFPEQLFVANGLLFFITDSKSDAPQLWRTDGTSGGTVRLSDTLNIGQGWVSNPRVPSYAVLGNAVYFRRQVQGREELWRTDGTAAGTLKVAADPLLAGAELYASGNQIFLLDRANNRLSKYVPGSAGPTFVLDIPVPFETTSVLYYHVLAYNGKLVFVAEFQPKSYSVKAISQVWVSNGTEAGTKSVAGTEFEYNGASSPIDSLTVSGGKLFFSVHNALWKSDGTRGGTGSVASFGPWGPYRLVDVQGTLYFAQNEKLMRTDGTAARTVAVGELPRNGYGNGYTNFMTASGGRLFFAGGDPVRDLEITVFNPDTSKKKLRQVRSLTPRVQYNAGQRRLTVTGTTYHDHLTVTADPQSGTVTVNWNGLPSTYRLADVGSVLVTGGDGGNDVLTLAGPVPAATLTGGIGDDVLRGGDLGDRLDGGDDDDRLFGGAGNDDLLGGADGERFYGDIRPHGDTLVGGAGSDALSGGDGYNDVVDYSDRAAPVTVSFDGRRRDGEAGERDNVLDDVERVFGGSGNDHLIGNDSFKSLFGNYGDDTLEGGEGSDSLNGGRGNDMLIGGPVRAGVWTGDAFVGGPGSDTMIGGSANDEFFGIDGGGTDWIYGKGGDDTAHVDRKRRDRIDAITTVLFT